jgi:hypothetical protein
VGKTIQKECQVIDLTEWRTLRDDPEFIENFIPILSYPEEELKKLEHGEVGKLNGKRIVVDYAGNREPK